MKDIKSFIIGFLSCVCIMLFMGQTKITKEYTKNDSIWDSFYKGSGKMDSVSDAKKISKEKENEKYYMDYLKRTAGIQQEPCSLGREYTNEIGHWYTYNERTCLQQGGDWIEGLQKENNTTSLNSNGRYQVATSVWDNEMFTLIMDTQSGEIIKSERTNMKGPYENFQDYKRMMNNLGY